MKPWLLFTLLAAAFPARAQTAAPSQTVAQAQAVAPSQKIEYRRNVPKAVARLMPRGAKSLFFGQLPASLGHGNLTFHLFTSEPKQFLRASNNTKVRVKMTLDVISGSKVMRRLSRADYSYLSSYPPSRFGMRFYWLDPKAKTQPLVVVDSFNKGDYGPVGLQHFLVFPKDWSGQPTVQQLMFGSWHASDTAGQDNFLVLDEKDLLGIECVLYPATSEISREQIEENYRFSLRWDGSGFKPTKTLGRIAERYYKPPQ